MENHITATCPNWLTARRTLGAVQSFKKFYPEVPLIIVDDHSNSKDKSTFDSIYSRPEYRPEVIYDPDNSKLRGIEGTTFITARPHNTLGKGHGNAIDSAADLARGGWLFHMDSDVRLVKGGLLEEMMKHARPDVAAIGELKVVNPKMPNLHNTFALYNLDLFFKMGVSFKPIIYNGRVRGYFPECEHPGQALEAGTEFCGMAHRIGYKLIDLPGIINEYGHHLRYTGEDKDEVWQNYY